HLLSHGFFGHPLVVPAALGVQAAHERLGTEHVRELREELLPRDDASRLHRARIEIEQREPLPDEHLGRRKMAPTQAIRGRQQVVVAVALVDELAPVPAIEHLEVRLPVAQQRIPGAIVAIDVAPAAQGQVEVGKGLVRDDVREALESGLRHSDSRARTETQSSMSKPSSTATHGRSLPASARHTRATACTTRPAEPKRWSGSRPAVMCRVTVLSRSAPSATALRTERSSSRSGSTASTSTTSGSSGLRRRFTGGRSPKSST